MNSRQTRCIQEYCLPLFFWNAFTLPDFLNGNLERGIEAAIAASIPLSNYLFNF